MSDLSLNVAEEGGNFKPPETVVVGRLSVVVPKST
jgi:hypothetical protein